MTSHQRFQAFFHRQPLDRLPRIEWATWWDKTLDRWAAEANPCPAVLKPGHRVEAAIHEFWGLDPLRQLWVAHKTPGCPEPAHHGAPLVSSFEEYAALRPFLFPEPAVDQEKLERWYREREAGGPAVWFTLEGFFWFPRQLLGIENHLLAFYDEPELMNQINADLTAFHLRVIDEVCRHGTPDFMTFAEDMSYNLGPMISQECFREFLTPWYLQVTPALKAREIPIIVDSDGDITRAVPWFIEAGAEGILPLECQSGVDVFALQQAYPSFFFLGGFDKLVMKLGEAAMHREFERLRPAIQRGGFLPSVDHQTPPDVSMENYRTYVKLLEEFTL